MIRAASEKRFDAIHYVAVAFFKLNVFVFNPLPYLALRIMGWPALFMGFSITTAKWAPPRDVLARRSLTYCQYVSVAPRSVRPDLVPI